MRAENMVNCPSCGATLVAGLRFCRMCGYRLGEGVEEYVPTQRFDAASMPTTTAPTPSSATDPFQSRQTWGAAPMQPARPFGAPAGLSGQQEQGATSTLSKACRPARGGWWLWVVFTLAILIAAGSTPLWIRIGPSGPAPAPSFLGVDSLESAPGGGALLTGISGPETPMLRAGLIGGDIIKTFDGKEVRDASGLRRILAETPVGKTVPVGFIRDGVFSTTQLTTVARKDTPGRRPFDQRPGGAGNIELDVDDNDRVQVPGMQIFGVELDDIERNGPADIAGLRRDDIVIKFGDFPIRTPGDLRYRIFEAVPGTTVPVTIIRGTEQLEIQVKVGRSKD